MVPAKRVVNALDVEMLDRRNAAHAVTDIRPALRNRVAHGRNEAKASDHDASLRHGRYLG